MGLVSACVLAIQALIRPFRWPNIMIPLVPEKLEDLIESPVPIIAGMLSLNKKNQSAIWVDLDDPFICRRIKGSPSLIDEVEEVQSKELRSSLRSLLGLFSDNNVFSANNI